jgi:hypothetical protein
MLVVSATDTHNFPNMNSNSVGFGVVWKLGINFLGPLVFTASQNGILCNKYISTKRMGLLSLSGWGESCEAYCMSKRSVYNFRKVLRVLDAVVQ